MKAIVMETRKDQAAVLLKDGTFRVIKGKYTVGETIELRGKALPTAVRRMATAAAAALILMAGAGGGFWYDANYVAYAEISLDVNPSIVYTVNKQSRVLEVKAVDDDAADVVSTLENAGVRFMPVSEAIETTMEIFGEEGYLDAENEDYVLMNVSADNDGLQEDLTSEIETGMEHAMKKNATMEFRVDHSDRATARRAAEKHMSTGRYAVWEQEGGEREPEEFAEMPIREVMGKPAETPPAAPEESDAPKPEEGNPAAPSGANPEQAAPENPDGQPPEMGRLPDHSNRQPPETGMLLNNPDQPNAPGTYPSESGWKPESSFQAGSGGAPGGPVDEPVR